MRRAERTVKNGPTSTNPWTIVNYCGLLWTIVKTVSDISTCLVGAMLAPSRVALAFPPGGPLVDPGRPP